MTTPSQETDNQPKKPINPFMKQVLELGPTLVFFLLYMRMRDNSYMIAGAEYSGFITATLIFIPVLLLAMGALWYLTGELSRIQVFTAFMVIFFGGLTAYFNDERFFKMKTTLVYMVFAILLGIGLLQGRSYLAYILSGALPLAEEGWMILTRRLTVMFVVLALANELVWRTMSTDTWVKIETFGFPIALFLFLWSQLAVLKPYLLDPED